MLAPVTLSNYRSNCAKTYTKSVSYKRCCNFGRLPGKKMQRTGICVYVYIIRDVALQRMQATKLSKVSIKAVLPCCSDYTGRAFMS